MSNFLTAIETSDINGVIIGLSRDETTNTGMQNSIVQILTGLQLPHITLASIFDNSDAKKINDIGLHNIIYRCSRSSVLKNCILTTFTAKDKDHLLSNSPTIDIINSHLFSHIKVLLVDDNEINLKLARTLLEMRGINVTTALDGEQAILLANKEYYHLILMDLHMPKTNGFEASKIIRNTENPCKHTTIIALTANAMPEEQLQVFHSGMNDILLKPITEQQFMDSFSRWIENPQKTRHRPIIKENNKIDNNFSIFDKQESINLAGNNETLADELFPMLIMELENYRENLLLALQEDNLTALKMHIHKLHGGTKYCGVPELRNAAANFESIVDQKKADEYSDGLEKVISAINNLLEFNKNQLKSQ